MTTGVNQVLENKSGNSSRSTAASPQVIAVLGSTGSIGVSTLQLLRLHRENFAIFALCGNRNATLMYQQICEFEPRYAVMVDPVAAAELMQRCTGANLATEILTGSDALVHMAEHAEVDTVMAAIVGSAGLASTLAAAKSGKKLLLANKEALVMAGDLMLQSAAQSGAILLPVDSEHNAIFQCIDKQADFVGGVGSATSPNTTGVDLDALGVSRILLTGSGGPFRQRSLDAFNSVTPDQACAHPNWSMGRKISVDSATMMNKGLELIEACWLFNCSESKIDVLIHPQSVIHSMVEYRDGSVLAQLGQPDMRTPIAHTLAWPKRISSAVEPLDWTQMRELSFEAPDYQRFPALKVAREVARARGSEAVVLNAANEIAVEAFLHEKIGFTSIIKVIELALEKIDTQPVSSIENILAVDSEARALATQICGQLCTKLAR